ncbi:hypothetical protein [Nitrosomonas supralitoralis]|uniref:Uncharacterized protein n=1 Tax=Nitrosomonas supralitoralis TaxID=2116706 RepID=A0A2P7NRI5_9PROT|nr:hypothetical protein [Nitrosomonas supralitoralis]PSJ16085.1 hypothetical protein C7H79_15420 [Nitrosomonas supralitoralis]
MATGQEVLEYYGIPVDLAIDFINENIDQPEIIFNLANDAGITIKHLSDITGYSTDSISDYFSSSGLNSKSLNEVKLILNSSLGDLESLVKYNDHNGVLSTASLNEIVEARTSAVDYEYYFTPFWLGYELADNVLTSDELGVSNLGDLPANTESIEYVIFGTLINLYSYLDETEISQLKQFSHNESNRNEYRSLLIEDLKDSANYTDQALADLVVNETVTLIEEFWDVDTVGVLDHSLLGLAGEI